MQQLRRSTLSRLMSYFVAVALLAPQLFIALPLASAQTMKQVTAAAVIPFEDQSGSGKDFVAREMTSAAALAFEATREYTVTATTDLERELASMGVQAPLSKDQQIRIGQRLQVEKVITGAVSSLSVDAKSGACALGAWIMMLDVGVAEYLDGATVSVRTNPIPGWSGDVDQSINEAMRAAAEQAVASLLGNRVRRGNVDAVDDLGYSTINLGTSDGLARDTDLLVMRPQWQPDLEKVLLRRVGVLRVKDIDAKSALCQTVEGSKPASGDKVYRMYKPVAVMRKEEQSRKTKETGKLVAGALLLLGLVGVAVGPTTSSPSRVQATLTQSAPGDSPVVRLTIKTGNIANTNTHGTMIFRAANNPDFPAIALNLIDVMPGKVNTYTDEASRLYVVEDPPAEITFQYFDEGGDLTDGSLTATYNHTTLVQGGRYYYKVCRVTDPLFPPGTKPPIGTTQAVTLTEPSIETEPDSRIISQPSPPAGPVTFFLPAIQSTPSDGAVNQPTQNITFTWQPTTGADTYVVEVFPDSDPQGKLSPVYQSAVQRATGTTLMSATIRGPFTANTRFWWRVGSRQSTDPVQPFNQFVGRSGWLYSTMRSLTTAGAPPEPPGTSSAQPKPVPDAHRGWWGGSRGRQR